MRYGSLEMPRFQLSKIDAANLHAVSEVYQSNSRTSTFNRLDLHNSDGGGIHGRFHFVYVMFNNASMLLIVNRIILKMEEYESKVKYLQHLKKIAAIKQVNRRNNPLSTIFNHPPHSTPAPTIRKQIIPHILQMFKVQIEKLKQDT